jgi:hypothetical protein
MENTEQAAIDAANAKAAAEEAKALAKAQADAAKAEAKVKADAARAEAKAAKDAAAKAVKEAKEAAAVQAKAAKEAAAAEAKAKKDAEVAAKNEAKAAEAAAKAQAKAEAAATKTKVVMPSQNGITRPRPDGACGKVWAIADAISQRIGQAAPINLLAPECSAAGLNDATTRTQYARWKTFNGVFGAVPKYTAQVVETAAATETVVA